MKTEVGIICPKKFLRLDDIERHCSLHGHLIHALGKQSDQVHIALHGHAVQRTDVVHQDVRKTHNIRNAMRNLKHMKASNNSVV